MTKNKIDRIAAIITTYDVRDPRAALRPSRTSSMVAPPRVSRSRRLASVGMLSSTDMISKTTNIPAPGTRPSNSSSMPTRTASSRCV